MAHINELIFFQQHAPRLTPEMTMLEIGSKPTACSLPWRRFFPTLQGLDLEPGAGVEIVHDLMDGPYERQFDVVLCCSVLEHTLKPWIVAESIAQMVKPNGWLYLTVPWNWRRHDYPIDYWRMSTGALKTLFPNFLWTAEGYSTKDSKDFTDERTKDVWECTFKQKRVSVVLTQLSHLLGQRKDHV